MRCGITPQPSGESGASPRAGGAGFSVSRSERRARRGGVERLKRMRSRLDARSATSGFHVWRWRPAGAIDRVRTADGPTIETAMAAAGFAALRYEHVGAFGSVSGWCIGQVMASPCEHVHSNPASRSSGNVKRSTVGTAIRMDNCSTIHPPARRRSRRRIFYINRQTTTVVLCPLFPHLPSAGRPRSTAIRPEPWPNETNRRLVWACSRRSQ